MKEPITFTPMQRLEGYRPVYQAGLELANARREILDRRCTMTELERQKHIGIAQERYEQAQREFARGSGWADDEALLV